MTDLNPCPDCVVRDTSLPGVTIRTLCPRCVEALAKHRPLHQSAEPLQYEVVDGLPQLKITSEPLMEWRDGRNE